MCVSIYLYKYVFVCVCVHVTLQSLVSTRSTFVFTNGAAHPQIGMTRC